MSAPGLRPPRRGGAVASPAVRARTQCPSCGAPRYRCTTADGVVVVLDAVPRDGGRFLVNPYTCTIVSDRALRGRGVGFVEHRSVCPAVRRHG